jgi:hypothetical protein
MDKGRVWMVVAVAAVVLGSVLAGTGAVSEDGRPKAEPVELSGRLRRPVKWSPQLDLGLSGQIRYFDLHGDLLEGIKEGTALRVTGVVRTRYHRGGTAENPSPFPSQWVIWLEVTELEVLDGDGGGSRGGAGGEGRSVPSGGRWR